MSTFEQTFDVVVLVVVKQLCNNRLKEKSIDLLIMKDQAHHRIISPILWLAHDLIKCLLQGRNQLKLLVRGELIVTFFVQLKQALEFSQHFWKTFLKIREGAIARLLPLVADLVCCNECLWTETARAVLPNCKLHKLLKWISHKRHINHWENLQ